MYRYGSADLRTGPDQAAADQASAHRRLVVAQRLDQLGLGHRRAALDADLAGALDQVLLGPVGVRRALPAALADLLARAAGRGVGDPGRLLLAVALPAQRLVLLFVLDLCSRHGPALPRPEQANVRVPRGRTRPVARPGRGPGPSRDSPAGTVRPGARPGAGPGPPCARPVAGTARAPGPRSRRPAHPPAPARWPGRYARASGTGGCAARPGPGRPRTGWWRALVRRRQFRPRPPRPGRSPRSRPESPGRSRTRRRSRAVRRDARGPGRRGRPRWPGARGRRRHGGPRPDRRAGAVAPSPGRRRGSRARCGPGRRTAAGARSSRRHRPRTTAAGPSAGGGRWPWRRPSRAPTTAR